MTAWAHSVRAVSAAVCTVGTLVAAAGAASAAPRVDVSPGTALRSGDVVTVAGSGFDPDAGYYVSTCIAGSAGPAGPRCVGGSPQQGTFMWVTNNPEAPGTAIPLSDAGTFETDLTVETTGNGVDCREDECAVTVYYDYVNGFGTVFESPLEFTAAGAPTTAKPPGTTVREPLGVNGGGTGRSATEAADDSSPLAWTALAAASILIVAGGIAILTRRRARG
ncbi:neocarzinostatin apoprotein domain-containing protein [Hoyosella subflava]|uniref:Putative thiamine biosynthesis protein X n=1 Tax=Hoyosella subflava (strain DSM 45089 / JCM 17490 / NBRC 109087 / DQS3-9A1) TaxID=443218 RepID=F6END3_HOYSD|nr:neocarzinostatin apoprotein domain-containing protein [Hoyosella subflava]AEF40404.1 Putative thiamine biosynthesis protein X [Hoyosella subflava DQS3-9A1]